MCLDVVISCSLFFQWRCLNSATPSTASPQSRRKEGSVTSGRSETLWLSDGLVLLRPCWLNSGLAIRCLVLLRPLRVNSGLAIRCLVLLRPLWVSGLAIRCLVLLIRPLWLTSGLAIRCVVLLIRHCGLPLV